MALKSVPEVALSSGNAKAMPVLGLGTGGYPHLKPEEVVKACLKQFSLVTGCLILLQLMKQRKLLVKL